MDPVVAGSLIGAGSSLIGGIMGADSAADAAKKNVRYQKEFAKKGIQWRVKDAIKAGIHPLAALGASGASYQPVSSGPSVGDAIADAGQNVGRAVAAVQPESDRAWDSQMKAEQLRAAKLNNTLIESQITSINNPTNPPAPGASYNIPGQTQSQLKAGWSENYSIPDVGWAETSPGVFIAVPSDQMKQRIEDNIFHEGAHFLRNNLTPNRHPPDDWLKKGQEWQYDWSAGGYRRGQKGVKRNWSDFGGKGGLR